MKKLKKALSGEEEDDEQGIMTQVVGGESSCTSLSWETRIKGFLICFIIGIVLSIVGSIFIFLENFAVFGVLYTAGNVCALSSTLFLMGPVKQLKNMFKATRLIATIVMIISLGLTLCAAFWWKNGALTIIFCIIQFLAMTWYSISYIPFARDAVKKCFSACVT